MSKKIYVVMGEAGEYSDWDKWTVKAFGDEQAAKDYVVAAQAASRKAVSELEEAAVSICFAVADEIGRAEALGYVVRERRDCTDILHPVTGLALRRDEEHYHYEEVTLDE